MHKNFNGWNEKKINIHNNNEHRLYHEQDIWWCSLGVNVGFEEDGKGCDSERPVLIIRGFNKQLCWAVPLSTSIKINPYYIPIGLVAGKKSSAIISQMRLMDTKRLINYIGFLNNDAFTKTKQAIKALL
jgi:mRNA interferase MazF